MDLHDIKRKYFRISVKGNDAVSVKINKVPYEVMALNDGGIGILLKPEDMLIAAGDELPLELKIDDLVLTLRGKVVHITPMVSEEFHCGIEFMDIDKKGKAKVLNFLESCREKIFKES
jgi:c-di-GMP-binding flagellar brake protein YcgR